MKEQSILELVEELSKKADLDFLVTSKNLAEHSTVTFYGFEVNKYTFKDGSCFIELFGNRL